VRSVNKADQLESFKNDLLERLTKSAVVGTGYAGPGGRLMPVQSMVAVEREDRLETFRRELSTRLGLPKGEEERDRTPMPIQRQVEVQPVGAVERNSANHDQESDEESEDDDYDYDDSSSYAGLGDVPHMAPSVADKYSTRGSGSTNY